MESSPHDTIDLLDELDEDAELVDEVAAAPAGTERGRLIESLLVGITNLIWAIVGLVLWLPQAVRAVLVAAARTIHGAMTQQASGRAIAGIQRASRSYVERFLCRSSQSGLVGRRQELRLIRLLGEIAWTVLFYLVVLRWLSPTRFAPIWQQIRGWGDSLASSALALLGGVGELAQFDLSSLDTSPLRVGSILVLACVVSVLLGIWLGRRGR